jgi:hypothetical protein
VNEKQVDAAIRTTKKATAAVRKAQRILAASEVPPKRPANIDQLQRELRRLHEAFAYVEGYVERETSPDERKGD